ncbi:MAG: DUF4359 domain-containing protein [Cyanobacteria bacterium]|nr:DUF4359 domain-containing protein [Cyanobacteriota bacterium]MDW8201600.1 DUF4359 domain-containing protein [Cyanobacteriota bacterium SKYGB_h_bin112]
MKQSRVVIGLAIGLILAGVGAIMALTNPDQSSYERYATQRLTAYLQDNVCTPQLKLLGASLQQDCRRLLMENQADIQQLIARGTQRQNFILFSHYTTNLSVNTIFPLVPADLVPSYRVETIGVLQNFYIFKTEQQ